MAEKLGVEQVPPPGVKRDLKPFQSIKSESVKLSEGGEEATISAQDVADLDADRPAVGIACGADEMGAMNPVYDRSEHIEYYFYKCSYEHCNKGKYQEAKSSTPRKLFAEAREDARRETTECTCVVEPKKKKAYQNPKIQADQYVHGEMRLYHFKAMRPKE